MLLRTLILSITAVCLCFAAENEHTVFTAVSRIAFTSEDHTVTASSENGPVSVAWRQLQLDVKRTDNLPQRATLLIVFDPASGIYWTNFLLNGLGTDVGQSAVANVQAIGRDIRFYSGPRRIVAFDARASFFRVSESTSHAGSLNEAEEKAFETARVSFLSSSHTKNPNPSLEVNPLQSVDASVTSEVGSAASTPCRFESLERAGSNWEIGVTCREAIRLTLTDKYELKGWDRITAP